MTTNQRTDENRRQRLSPPFLQSAQHYLQNFSTFLSDSNRSHQNTRFPWHFGLHLAFFYFFLRALFFLSFLIRSYEHGGWKIYDTRHFYVDEQHCYPWYTNWGVHAYISYRLKGSGDWRRRSTCEVGYHFGAYSARLLAHLGRRGWKWETRTRDAFYEKRKAAG